MGSEKENRLGFLDVRNYVPKSDFVQGNPVKKTLYIGLRRYRSASESSGEGSKIETIASLPRVRFISPEDCPEGQPVPYPLDRGKTWKKLGEWVYQLVISAHPKVCERERDDSRKGQKWKLLNGEEPDFYRWFEDEELLSEIRPRYSNLREKMIEKVGRPLRSDFNLLFPHSYDDEGLSDRGRRTVRELRAIFGKDIVKVSSEMVPNLQ